MECPLNKKECNDVKCYHVTDIDKEGNVENLDLCKKCFFNDFKKSKESSLIIHPSVRHNICECGLSFEQYIYDRKFPIDSDKYTDSLGNLIVNRILHYENLQKELIDIEKELGFKPILESRIKSGFREDIKVSNDFKKIIYNEFNYSNFYTGYSF